MLQKVPLLLNQLSEILQVGSHQPEVPSKHPKRQLDLWTVREIQNCQAAPRLQYAVALAQYRVHMGHGTKMMQRMNDENQINRIVSQVRGCRVPATRGKTRIRT